jgi:hypothetical protein
MSKSLEINHDQFFSRKYELDSARSIVIKYESDFLVDMINEDDKIVEVLMSKNNEFVFIDIVDVSKIIRL